MAARITAAERKDLKEILNLQYLAYQSEAALFGRNDIEPLTQTLGQLQDEYDRGKVLKLVDESGKIIGSVRARQQSGTVYIGKLMVHPDHRRKGLGRELIKAAEGLFEAERYELFTSTRSANNIRLYESLGYKEFKRRHIDGEIVFVYLEKFVDAKESI